MGVILLTSKWHLALMYLDNIVLFKRNVHNHMAHLQQVPTALWDAGVTLKLKNARCFLVKTSYLGRVMQFMLSDDKKYIEEIVVGSGKILTLNICLPTCVWMRRRMGVKKFVHLMDVARTPAGVIKGSRRSIPCPWVSRKVGVSTLSLTVM